MFSRPPAVRAHTRVRIAIAVVVLSGIVATTCGVPAPQTESAGGARADGTRAGSSPSDANRDEASYGSGGRALTTIERAGRDTWHFWTAGNEIFWRQMTVVTAGNVDLLMYVDSRLHDRRFEALGVVNDPDCRAAQVPDRFGLWLDDCARAEAVADIPGAPSGVVGLRRFENPAFDPSTWSVDAYRQRPATIEPPYLIGMACGFCHVGFHPARPPADPNRPAWANLLPTIGNQYFQEGKLFSLRSTSSDFLWHVASRQAPGTSDTSRLATDHISNPSAINAIFDLADRPTFPERMRDGTTRQVPHLLKDGADSIGLAGAALRVYVNIGMCGQYWTTRHDPIDGVRKAQEPFDIDQARATCPAWKATAARIPAVEAFLKTLAPVHLSDAPGSGAYLAASADVLRRGKIAFADRCARCHSSKQPPTGTRDPARWYRDSVLADDFLTRNFLSNDERYPVTLIGTNITRALASNAVRGHIWDQFSSDTYKTLPAVGSVTGLFDPRDPSHPIDVTLPGDGRGYYRTTSLASAWATAPYLHNNSVGVFIKDPSVGARMAAFADAMEKLLWPETRLGPQSIAVTTTDSVAAVAGTTRTIRVPKGTPIDYLAQVDAAAIARAAAALPAGRLVLTLAPDDAVLAGVLRGNLAPDYVVDRGHTFGADLPEADKRALIEFIKTF